MSEVIEQSLISFPLNQNEAENLYCNLMNKNFSGRRDILHIFRKNIAKTQDVLPFESDSKFQSVIYSLLSDDEWTIRVECLIILKFLLSQYGEKVDEYIIPLMPKIIVNISHEFEKVRRATKSFLHAYLNHTRKLNVFLKSIIECGLLNNDNEIKRQTVLVIKSFITEKLSQENLAPLIKTLAKLFFSGDTEIVYPVFMTLKNLQEIMGRDNFYPSLISLGDDVVQLYDQTLINYYRTMCTTLSDEHWITQKEFINQIFYKKPSSTQCEKSNSLANSNTDTSLSSYTDMEKLSDKASAENFHSNICVSQSPEEHNANNTSSVPLLIKRHSIIPDKNLPEGNKFHHRNFEEIFAQERNNQTPYLNVKEALNTAIQGLASNIWAKKIESMSIIRRLSNFHGNVLIQNLSSFATPLCETARSLQSVTAHVAIATIGFLFISLENKMKDREIKLFIHTLLEKSADCTKTIQEAVDKALENLIVHLPPMKISLAMVSIGGMHRNHCVRKTTAKFLSRTVSVLGYQCLDNRCFTEKLLPAVSRFVTDGPITTRYYGKKIFSILIEHPQFNEMFMKCVDANIYKQVDIILRTIRKRGIGKKPK